jgi:hypothetical protein
MKKIQSDTCKIKLTLGNVGQQKCENILRGYLYVCDLAFVILKGIYGFKFLKRFLEISSRDLTSFFLLQHQLMPFPLHLHGSMPCKQQSDIPTVYQTHVFAKLHKQIEH